MEEVAREGHLPAAKRRELARVVQALFEEFADAHGSATSERKRGRILKVVLYGSYARGGWVDDGATAGVIPCQPDHQRWAARLTGAEGDCAYFGAWQPASLLSNDSVRIAAYRNPVDLKRVPIRSRCSLIALRLPQKCRSHRRCRP